MVPAHLHAAGRALVSLLLVVLLGAAVAATSAQGSRTASSHKPAATSSRAGEDEPAGLASLPRPPYGAAAGTELDQLPVLQPETMASGASSFDRNTSDASHGNHDMGNFLATGPDGNVMLDKQGPGCVYRIWVTGEQAAFPDQWIKVFFNGSAVPAIDMTIAQMFAGTNAPFLAPLVAGATESSGGYVSYVPLCYSRSIKITTSMTRYYDIGYEAFPPGTAIRTWSPGQSTAALRREWQNVGADPISADGSTTVAGQVRLDPGIPRTIFDAHGPRSIQSVRLAIPGVTADAGTAAEQTLDHTWIKIFWDGRSSPAVSAPIGSFFGLGQFGSSPARGLVAGIDGSGTLYMYLPMPFRRHATIELVDTTTASRPAVGYQVQYQPFTGGFADVGYLTTRYTTTSKARPGRDIPVLDTTGSGKLVGITASYTGSVDRSYLEGDERIYVDGSGSPAFYGTGTEDFFNGGYYFEHGPFSQPVSGNTVHFITATSDQTAAYRFMLQDAIGFRRRLVVTFQHGPYDNTTGTSASILAYYYRRPATQSRLTDSIDVGNAASEAAHRYLVTGQVWHGTNSYTYPGTADKTVITDAGRGYRGHSQFALAIAPRNQGVDLRRRYDAGVADQKALVYVDGRRAGTWYVAGANHYHRWADSDFLIPATFTTGKRSITIRIRRAAGADLTDYAYWAYTITRQRPGQSRAVTPDYAEVDRR